MVKNVFRYKNVGIIPGYIIDKYKKRKNFTNVR